MARFKSNPPYILVCSVTVPSWSGSVLVPHDYAPIHGFGYVSVRGIFVMDTYQIHIRIYAQYL